MNGQVETRISSNPEFTTAEEAHKSKHHCCFYSVILDEWGLGKSGTHATHDVKCDRHLGVAVALAMEPLDTSEQPLYNWGLTSSEWQVAVHVEGADTGLPIVLG